MQRRHLLQTTLATLPAAALWGCAGLGGPTVITLSEADLAVLIARSFPMQRRLLEMFDVQLNAPQLRLMPASNRLSVGLALTTQDRFFGNSGRGTLTFDAALRYEPRDASVRLNQVRVQNLGFEASALPPPLRTPAPSASGGATVQPAPPPVGPLARLGNALAEQALENLVIYSVPAERQASLRQLGLQPGAVTVTSRGVEISFARIAP